MITQTTAIYSPQNRAAHALASRDLEGKLIKAKRIIAELNQNNETLASNVLSLECKVKLLSKNRHELLHTVGEMQAKLDRQVDNLTSAKYRIRCLVAKLMTYESNSQKIFDIGVHVDIVDMVTKHFEMTFADLQKPNRKRTVKTCRHILCYLLRRYTELNSLEIAKLAGLTNHTSALHAIAKVGELMEYDEQYKEVVTALASQIEEIISNQSNNNKQSC